MLSLIDLKFILSNMIKVKISFYTGDMPLGHPQGSQSIKTAHLNRESQTFEPLLIILTYFVPWKPWISTSITYL